MLTFEVVEGDRPGRLIHVSTPVCEIGREAAGGVRLHGEQVWPRHAVVRFDQRQWVIEGLDATAATRRNGVAITQPMPLAIGDRLRLGDVLLVVRSASPPTANHQAGDLMMDHFQMVFPHMKPGHGVGGAGDTADKADHLQPGVGETGQARPGRLSEMCQAVRSWLW